MPILPEHSPLLLLGFLGTVALMAACSGDTPTAPEADPPSLAQAITGTFSICHTTGAAGGSIIQVTAAELAAHQRHGDYVTRVFVSHAADQPSDAAHFRRIVDAVDAARAVRSSHHELQSAPCRITIVVAAGVYRGTDEFANTSKNLEHFPYVIDMPDITLRGALVMALDASGRATGASSTHETTTLAPIRALSDVDGGGGLFFVVGDPTGSAGNGFTLEGFALRSGRAPGPDAVGTGLLSFDVRNLIIRGNRLEGFFETIDLRGSSGLVKANHLKDGGQCDICIAGPGTYRVADNRLLAGGTHGIFTSPAINTEPEVPTTSEVVADISNNVVRDHRKEPISAGIRVGAVGLGAPNIRGTSHIHVRDNLLVNNNFGLMIDALFPRPGTELKGDVDLNASGNVVRQSCQAPLFVAFARHTTALAGDGLPYLLNSTYRLSLGGDLRFSDAWFSNPKGLGNTLRVNGRLIAHTTRQFFDPTTCPGTAAITASGAGSGPR